MPKISVKQLESFKVTDAGQKLFDGEGLYGKVRIQKTGVVVTFEYRYTTDGRTRSSSCGKWPALTLKEIRRLRDAKRSNRESGQDPIELRRTEKIKNKIIQVEETNKLQQEFASLSNRRTFVDAIAHWHKFELCRRKDLGLESMRGINKDVIPVVGNMPLEDVSRPMLLDVFDKVVERGAKVMANHLYGDLRQFYNYALNREWVDKHPLIGLTKEKIGGRQKERDRYLTEQEIIELSSSFSAAKLPKTTELAIWLMLSTGCRVGELSKATWADVDLVAGIWTIPKGNSKNAKEHTVFLSDFTKNIFQQLNLITGNYRWCYPSRDKKSHINEKSIAKQIRDKVRSTSVKGRSKASETLLLTGGEWTPHDLRRTAATMMGELGVVGEVIERCLNHVEQNKLKRTYQRHELRKEQKEAWQCLGNNLLLLLNMEVTDVV